jgi:membrane protease YdiL (CAAX protease family)
MCLPAIPAYLWLWPRVTPEMGDLPQALVYLYVLAGTLWIGRRYYPAQALGLNRGGIPPVLAWGGLVLLGRTLVILGVDWGAPPPAFEAARVLWEFVFYFGFVALTEELLFRGLVYRALLESRGASWAIYGSSVGFALWHVFGQGLLVGAAMLLYGWIFGLLRWRAGSETGGIWGLVLVHGLIDFSAAQMLPSLDVVGLGRPAVPHAWMLALGLLLILSTPLGLERLRRITQGEG